ncbi:MAG: flavodoxin family protein [Clostridia bacterium]|nr:flavodoxin family protein [Clostridia bacterium]
MRVLLLNGSPHEAGCTHAALAAVAAGLEEGGAAAEHVWIGREPVRGCIGCGGCYRKGRCVFDGDLVNELIGRMADMDGLVIGSPVYYASANGSLVALLDRLFYAGSAAMAHKPGAAVVSARRAGTTAALEVLNKYFAINQMPLVSSRYWNMVHGNTPEEAAQDLEGMQIMRQLGRNMAWLLACIEAGREKGIAPPPAEKWARTNFIR